MKGGRESGTLNIRIPSNILKGVISWRTEKFPHMRNNPNKEDETYFIFFFL